MVLLERRGREGVEGRRTTTRNARVEAALLQQLSSLGSYLHLLFSSARRNLRVHRIRLHHQQMLHPVALRHRIPIITHPQAAAPADEEEEEEEVGTEEHHRLSRTRSREGYIPVMG